MLISKSMATMIGAHIELILIVTGALTAIALLQFIAPASVLRMIYGEAPTDKVGLAVARHWGLLAFLVGAILGDLKHSLFTVILVGLAYLASFAFMREPGKEAADEV